MIFAELELAYALLMLTVLIFGGAAAAALAWAFRDGQLSNFARGATSIFDPDEPVGEVTDQVLDPERAGERRHKRSSHDE